MQTLSPLFMRRLRCVFSALARSEGQIDRVSTYFVSALGLIFNPSFLNSVCVTITARFLSSSGRDHIVGVGFISETQFLPLQAGQVESIGNAYYFDKIQSDFWSDDFSGVFGPAST